METLELCLSLSEYEKAEEYQRKALVITKEIGDKKGEAACYGNLGTVYESLGKYEKSEEYQRKALAITKEIGDKRDEAACYGNLGIMYHSLAEYAIASEFLNNALVINREIGEKEGEARCYGNLGSLFRSLGKHPEAKTYHKKALAMSREIGDTSAEANWHVQLACDAMSEGKEGLQQLQQVFWNLLASINRCEKIRRFLERHDQFKISLLEKHSPSYLLLSTLLCFYGNEKEAVCVQELGRARALADLISGQHSVQQQISVNPPSWADIERIVKKQSNCSCLYISYFQQCMFL